MSRKDFVKRTVVLPALYASLEKIGEFVNLASREAGFNESDCYKVQLAVDEACSNIIEHAYGGEAAEEDITCTCKVTADNLVVELYDHGQAFDPTEIPVPDVKAALHARATGGLGLYFMRQLMDEVSFNFTPGSAGKNGVKSKQGNHLILIKHKGALS